MGLFALAHYLTRSGLRILCYHGLALDDEYRLNPITFMRTETFWKRMVYIKKRGFPVLPLGEAIKRLNDGSLPPNATVITFDDGFYSTYSCAIPVLEEFALPACIYVTTYYCVQETPIFRLAVAYMFHKSQGPVISLRELLGGDSDLREYHGPATASPAEACWEIINHGERQCTEKQRNELLEKLATALGVDFARIRQERWFNIMTRQEIKDLASRGFDIQLHTHRHCLPENRNGTCAEIRENRQILGQLSAQCLQHLCYPSGVWSERHWLWLKEMGVVSATTCKPGFNYQSTPWLALSRFLDGDNIAQIEFQAEMTGYLELLRRARLLLRRNRSRFAEITANIRNLG